MQVSDVKKMKAEEENAILKRILCLRELEIQALKVMVKKKVITLPQKKEAMTNETVISERRACGLVNLHWSSKQYASVAPNDDSACAKKYEHSPGDKNIKWSRRQCCVSPSVHPQFEAAAQRLEATDLLVRVPPNLRLSG